MKQLGTLLSPGWDASPSQGPSMKQLGTLLSPGWDASPSQDTQHEATSNIALS